ncbi:hypothetical protein PVAP13_3NG140887 [Panicum virgatum]|uniref:Uncharacterized protein n=1 Tax=Panicum virgatum TaxID=38727 RepID=A0A8T0U3U3_PANVG|nr:hypothetical protein PVAP13_3NG140887 [Panicum virgatum]KAG2619251.1 hypothetical protein PVAP13_3NG140887 [Panicum virgatum]KAG2619252.1 hypothetical protein PVAP13_3NG140887 [Panicum virgatum]KAG2619254.1 hypothetical protein PVAP13_3NG140887 [Panicum virgatum]KAG2619255.1 hypothetical protein PVAP13_3NG140887 [Panicum virgatum]
MTPSVCRGRADSNSASLLAYCRPRCVDRGRERQRPFSASMLAHPHLSYRIIGDVLAGIRSSWISAPRIAPAAFKMKASQFG